MNITLTENNGSSNMDQSKQIQQIRYTKPLESIKENLITKGILSLGSWLTFDILSIFSSHLELILLLIVAMLIDFFTGCKNARDRGEFIRSFGFRQSIVKTLEYAAFLIIITGIANVFGRNELQGWVGDTLRLAKNIDWFAYFFLIFTELKSISENISGKKGKFSQLIEILNNKFFGGKQDDKWK